LALLKRYTSPNSETEFACGNRQQKEEIVKRRVTFAIVFSLGLVGSLLAADPFVGTFKLNLAASKWPSSPPKELTAVYASQGDGYLVTRMGTDADGKPISLKYTFPKKGGPVAATEGGPPSGVSTTVKKTDDYTTDGTTTQDGKVIQTVHTVVSKDGKTLTRTVKGIDAQGNPVDRVEVYDRQ
jgi:hypothetical protein